MADFFANDLIELRAFSSDDHAALAGYLNRPELLGLRQIERDPLAPIGAGVIAATIEEWTAPKTGMALAITPAREDGVVGHVLADWGWDAFFPWVGVAVAPDARRRGYGSAALRLVVDWLFDQTVAHSVHSWTPGWNGSGIAFLESMGFRRAGAMRRAYQRQGEWHDNLGFDQLRTEWEAR